MIVLNPTCFVLLFNLIVVFIFLKKIWCDSTEEENVLLLLLLSLLYCNIKKILIFKSHIKILTKHLVYLHSALILIVSSNFMKDLHGHFPFPECFSSWLCFPRPGISFGFDSHHLHFAEVPLPLPSVCVRLGEMSLPVSYIRRCLSAFPKLEALFSTWLLRVTSKSLGMTMSVLGGSPWSLIV